MKPDLFFQGVLVKKAKEWSTVKEERHADIQAIAHSTRVMDYLKQQQVSYEAI